MQSSVAISELYIAIALVWPALSSMQCSDSSIPWRGLGVLCRLAMEIEKVMDFGKCESISTSNKRFLMRLFLTMLHTNITRRETAISFRLDNV